MTDASSVRDVSPAHGAAAPCTTGHSLGTRPGPVPRHQARRDRNWEKALAVVVLLVAFAITIALLTLQWLGTGDQDGSSSFSRSASTVQVL
ncbi:MAG: hypothetical protein ACP5VR_04185 [Acidimicrobiales bacterium]